MAQTEISHRRTIESDLYPLSCGSSQMAKEIATSSIFYVRHAQPVPGPDCEDLRRLTGKGRQDALAVEKFLSTMEVHAIISSPYIRAIETIQPFADRSGLTIQIDDRLRERKVGEWVEDFDSFAREQWADFQYKLPGGECLAEVQKRNIEALEEILRAYAGKQVVIAGHGTALSSILNWYHPEFGYTEFCRLAPVMPLIIRFCFDGTSCTLIERVMAGQTSLSY